MPFNLFPILWRLLLLRMNKLLNFHYFFRNFTCNSPREMTEKERRARMGPDITEIMRLDGYTLYFPYWNIAYNIETGEQVE